MVFTSYLVEGLKTYAAQKTIFSFSKCSEKMIFPKKIAVEYDFCYIIRKDDISFHLKYDIIL